MGERTAAEFETFWKNYPRKVGKLDALKAYMKARTQASAAEILDGVARYVVNKPAYADWAHPGTWLRAGRWMDDYGSPTARPAEPLVDWWEECQQIHGGACEGDRMRHHQRKLIDGAKAKAS
jgi:hypothetical protein